MRGVRKIEETIGSSSNALMVLAGVAVLKTPILPGKSDQSAV